MAKTKKKNPKNYDKGITFEELNLINKENVKEYFPNTEGSFAHLDCPNCKKKWHKSYEHNTNAYMDQFSFKCPDCGLVYGSYYPKAPQHRSDWELRMKIRME